MASGRVAFSEVGGAVNSTQALTRLRKLLGPKAALRDNGKPSSPELREQQRATRTQVTASTAAAEEAMQARRKAILLADAEYQSLLAEYNEARALKDKTSHGHYHRYIAGRFSDMFFHVEAEADTLAELIDKVAAKKVAA